MDGINDQTKTQLRQGDWLFLGLRLSNEAAHGCRRRKSYKIKSLLFFCWKVHNKKSNEEATNVQLQQHYSR